ncbi:uncharacterized protein DUF3989 [Dysgonomonas alginatilytica]|uniref:Uncharacterized protein DUF3989 n=1 Tax=Dysgonomonas alginatilytica TaxID=1605892 RepID=A0A2V3PLP9_9BACT|nr:TraL conjugative transposon family protein [Dysgonomonas alginatilytica]PXV61077.1 uncharacterized protein DUF3989 [Dysgonomonas alginatilytica]
MKERIKELGYWFEDRLKDLCGEITPDKRLTVILIMLLIFTLGNLYFTISSIYNWGRESERQEQLKIEHIRNLDLKRKDLIDSDLTIPDINNASDSINQQNNYDYGRTNER